MGLPSLGADGGQRTSEFSELPGELAGLLSAAPW